MSETKTPGNGDAGQTLAPVSLLADWTDDRAEELKKLQMLLNEVRNINHGSGACERIRWCETVAETLSRVELEKPRDSFIQFLVTIACKDRQRAKSANAESSNSRP